MQPVQNHLAMLMVIRTNQPPSAETQCAGTSDGSEEVRLSWVLLLSPKHQGSSAFASRSVKRVHVHLRPSAAAAASSLMEEPH